MSGSLALPVSGARVALRPVTGRTELLLAEASPADPALALALAERLGDGEPGTDWAALPVHDIDTLIARLRQSQSGDRIVAEVACTDDRCGQRVDLSFGIDAYLAHHRPRALRGRGLAAHAGAAPSVWLSLEGEAARFRLPTLADQIAVAGLADPAAHLQARCIQPNRLPSRMRRRVEAAMAAMAPPLSGPLGGHCPECGTAIEAWFDLRQYCLHDLCARARYLFDDIDVLAERYHWSEHAILRLPRSRREQYAERARLARAA